MRYIVIALKSEAEPIIDFFHLKKIDDKKFQIFKNEKITLIISGIGKIESAIATTYLSPKPDCILINIGICGSPKHKKGELFQIKKIIDKSSAKVVHLKSKNIFNTQSITCCDTSQNDKVNFKNTLVDMESFGFYKSAKKFVKDENIYLIKVVSDNISDNILTKNEVYELIFIHLKSIKEKLF